MGYKGMRDAVPPVLAGASVALFTSAFSSHGARAMCLFIVASGVALLAVLAGWPR
jgi:hypothetical protein